MQIKVLYFAKIKDIIQKCEDTLTIQKTKITPIMIFGEIAKTYPTKEDELSKAFVNCLIAFNDEYVDNHEVLNLKDGDEISVIPPISSG